MEVTLVYFEGCPHWRLADERLRTALRHLGKPETAVDHRVVASAEHAEAIDFAGSPTILVDGRDAFPQADAPTGLSCRMFATPDGPAGAPTVDQLVDALA